MSQTMHAKRRIVARRVVAMSYCRSAQIGGLAYVPSHKATSQQRVARQHAVWRISLATRRNGDNDTGCVVAINNATRSVPNQPPYQSLLRSFSPLRKNIIKKERGSLIYILGSFSIILNVCVYWLLFNRHKAACLQMSQSMSIKSKLTQIY
jgi:hypothetical protein